MNQTDLTKLRDMIRRHEGLRLEPYKCPTGHLSIGYGHNLEAHGENIVSEISMDKAEEYLRRDISTALFGLAGCEYSSLFVHLDSVRQAALIDMTYNMGIGSLLKFKKMWAAMKAKDWDSAADEVLDSRYAVQVGRRAMEVSEMLRTGKWHG